MLDNKVLQVGTALGQPTTTTLNLTDNNLATYYDLEARRAGAVNTVFFDFGEDKILNGLKITKDGGRTLYVRFYSQSNTLLYEGNYRETNLTVTNLYVEGVRKVSFVNEHSIDAMRVYELNIIGELSIPPPKNLVAISDSKSVRLQWEDDPEANHTGYDIIMDGQLIATIPSNQKSYKVNNLTPDVEYDFYVRSNYGEFDSPDSNVVSAIAYDDPIQKPQLTALPYQNYIELSWNPVMSIHYRLYSGSSLIYSGSNLSYVHTGLQLDTNYVYRLDARDKYGRIVEGDLLQVRTREPPPPEPAVISLYRVNHDSISITWNRLAESFILFLDGQSLDTSSTAHTFAGLLPNTEYEIKIAYTDAYGRYVESLPINVTTAAPPLPIYPVLKAMSIKHDSLRLTWNSTGTAYKVFQNGELIAEQTSVFRQLDDLEPETAYIFQVFALDAYGRENGSNLLEVSTLAVPPPPTPKPSPTPRPPPVIPPDNSDTGNEDLDNINDHLVEGANESKRQSMVLIAVIIAIIILVFGCFWLVAIWKKKMSKATVGRGSKSNGNTAGQPVVYRWTGEVDKYGNKIRRSEPATARGSPGTSMRTIGKTSKYKNSNGAKTPQRRKYHVEKSYRKRY